MMKTRRKSVVRVLSLLLVISILFSVVACTKEANESSVTTSLETTTPQTQGEETTESAVTTEPLTEVVHRDPGFNKLTWNYTDFRILCDEDYTIANGGALVDTHARDVIYLEDQATSNINEAVRDRNAYITDTYEVTIKAVWSMEPWSVAKQSVKAKLDLCDICEVSLNEYMPMINDGQLLNMNGFSSYLDLTNTAWDQNCRENMSICHQLYFCTGDILICDKMGCWSILFNRDLIKDNNLENPYDTIDQGTWTYDKMYEMAAKVSDYSSHEPTDTFNITWGIVTEPSNTYLVWHGSGYQVIVKDPVTDVPMMAPMDESAYDAMMGVCKVQFSEGVSLMSNTIQNVVSQFEDGIIPIFKSGHSLFFIGSMVIVESMRNSEVDFGVLPLPKRDEIQKDYYSAQMSTKVYAVSIPDDGVNNKDFVGMITQALAVESTDTLLEAYYDKTLVYKGLRREEDEKMLDLIFANRVFDLSLCTSWADALSADVGSARTEKKLQRVKNSYDSYKNNMEKAIQTFLTKHNLSS